MTLSELQFVADVFDNFGRCRSCQCKKWSIRVDFPKLTYIKVGWSEVIAPLRDAVCFIDDYEFYRKRFEFYAELFA